MKEAIWNQNYTVSILVINPERQLSLYGLLNLLQDSAWIHATHLGHGYDAMIEDQTAWILVRQKCQMYSWPSWGDEITIKTWVRPTDSFIASRDFEIYLKGQKIGESTTQWLVMDLGTRKPSEKSLSLGIEESFNPPEDFIQAKKVPIKKDLKKISEIIIKHSDLDLNQHVNNTRYAQWILDALPDGISESALSEYEVNFLNETKSNDRVFLYGIALSSTKFHFQAHHVEDHRIIYSATLTFSAEQTSLFKLLS